MPTDTVQIDIAEVLTAGQRIGGVSTEAQSYVKSIDGPVRQAVNTNDGFASVRQLDNTLGLLGQRVDRLVCDVGATGGNIMTAAQAHVDTELRNRGAMDALGGRLDGITPNEPLGGTEHGQRTGLASAGPVTTPPPLGGWETASERAQSALGRFGNGASWMSDGHYGRFAPRGPNGQFISPGAMTPWQRAMAGANGEFRAIPNHSATRAAWATAGTWAGRVSTGLNTVTRTADQAARDWNNPNLTGDQKVGRAAWRGAVEGGSAWGGGAAGAKIGAGIGTLVVPGAGTVVGGIIGGIAGGFIGSQAGEWIADRTVGAAGDTLERITPW